MTRPDPVEMRAVTEGPSTSEQVTFLHPFLLPGMDHAHSPGTFEVWTDREEIGRASCRERVL